MARLRAVAGCTGASAAAQGGKMSRKRSVPLAPALTGGRKRVDCAAHLIFVTIDGGDHFPQRAAISQFAKFIHSKLQMHYHKKTANFWYGCMYTVHSTAM